MFQLIIGLYNLYISKTLIQLILNVRVRFGAQAQIVNGYLASGPSIINL